jgi:transcriptional regulator with XRE-family HTH domain
MHHQSGSKGGQIGAYVAVCRRCKARSYGRDMGWESFDVRRADPFMVIGTRLLGKMVADRPNSLCWSQRDLARYVGCHQSVISRLERGLLLGIRYRRFARIVAVLGGLEPDGPTPEWMIDRRGPNPYLARLEAEAAAAATVPKIPVPDDIDSDDADADADADNAADDDADADDEHQPAAW